MGFIDIVKLNNEIEKLIATQAAEIEEMREEADARAEYRFLQMMTSFEEMGLVAKEIGEIIVVYTDDLNRYRETNPYYVSFNKFKESFGIECESEYCGRYTCVQLKYGCAYDVLTHCGKKEIVNVISKWWAENATEFRRRFEEECIKAIRVKAERPNKKYAKAKEECE